MNGISILGAGAWGLALAQSLAMAGRQVAVWARDGDQLASCAASRQSPRLTGIALHPAIAFEPDLARIANSRALLAVTPAQTWRALARSLAATGAKPVPVILCAKGIERETGALITDVTEQELPGWPVAVLSGPSFARDVARGLPTAVTLACANAALGNELVHAIGSPRFRPYLSTDPLGAEIGGAVKNVLAIACGIAVGRGFGDSARAALITRGFAETVRFALALGAERETLSGLSGLGDLILTCSSPLSRNFSLGLALGEGNSVAQALEKSAGVVEGAQTAPALLARASQLGVDMPIAASTAAILRGDVGVDEAIMSLLTRPYRAEA